MERIPAGAKFAVFFGGAGFILSITSGLMAGVDIGTAIIRAVIFLFVMAGIGYGYYFIFSKYVPPLLAAIAGEDIALGESGEVSTAGDDPGSGDSPFGNEDTYGVDESSMDASGGSKRADDGNYGDHLIVEGVKIENEPKLMADAIRTMMSKDEDGSGGGPPGQP